MTSPLNLDIPLTLSHTFSLGAGWSIAPELKTEWQPIAPARPLATPIAVSVTFKLAF